MEFFTDENYHDMTHLQMLPRLSDHLLSEGTLEG
jgi:hypothetical protein